MRAGLSIWFYIYKDQMALLEMIFDLGHSRSWAKIFFFFPPFLISLLVLAGPLLQEQGELCVCLSGLWGWV